MNQDQELLVETAMRFITTAETAGLADVLFAMTVQYSEDRIAFGGRPG